MNLDELRVIAEDFTEEVKQLNIVEGVYAIFRTYPDKNDLSLIAITQDSFVNGEDDKEELNKLEDVLVKYNDLTNEKSIVNTYQEYSFSYSGETFKLFDTYTLKMLASGSISYDKYGTLTELKNSIKSSEMYQPFACTTQIEFDNYKTRG